MKLDNIIYETKNKKVYRDGDLAIKVFDENFSKAAVLNEALNQARVEEIEGIHTPKLHQVTVIDGKWAIVTDFIEGTTLQQLMEQNPDKLDEYLNLFVNLQIEILSKRSPLLTDLRNKMQRKISESKLDATTRYELHTRINGMKKHNKVCHGDFVPSNIIITPDGTPYIIDWAHVTQGNGAADAARTYLMMNLKGRIELAEKYLNLYCSKTDTAKQLIQNWMPIVAASQSVKQIPEEMDLLMKWASVADYE
ncbi:MAG: phosphotransferase [Ruminococcus sp.]|nr:phosphotransferase [Ruminococcus sp.]